MNTYTPIKDKDTKQLLSLGDFVESEKGVCGTLSWCDYSNRYLIKTEGGGNSYARYYRKIDFKYDNNIDVSSVECRRAPNKNKW